MIRGMVESVDTSDAADFLTVDCPAGTTVLPVDNTDVFETENDSGSVQINDEIYTYSSVDDDEDVSTITLDTPLLTDAEVNDRVAVWPLSPETIAQVIIDDVDGALSARVPSELATLSAFTDGIRDGYEQLAVLVDLDGNEAVVVEVVNEPSLQSGTRIDPTTTIPPAAMTDGLPPEFAPFNVTASPFAVGAVATSWEAPVNADPLTFRIHASFTSPVAEDDTALQYETKSTTTRLANVSGVDIPADPTEIFIKVQSADADGPGPFSAEVSATTRAADGFISALYAYLGDVQARQITSGKIDTEVIDIGDYLTLDGTESTFTLWADIDHTIPVVQFGPDGSVIRVRVETDEISSLGAVILKSIDSQIAAGGGLTVGNGVADPKSGPTLSASTAPVASWPRVPSGFRARGISWDATDGCWIRLLVTTANGVRDVCRVEKIHATTGASLGYVSLSNIIGQSENDLNSVVRVGSSYYVASFDDASPASWAVAKFAVSTGAFQTLSPNNWTGVQGRMCVGVNNAGDVVQWHVYTGAHPTLRLVILNPTTLAITAYGDYDTNWAGSANLMGYGELTYGFGFTATLGEAAVMTDVKVHAIDRTYSGLVAKPTYDITLSGTVTQGGVGFRPGVGWHSTTSGAGVLGLYSKYINPGTNKAWVTYTNRDPSYTTLDSPAASVTISNHRFVIADLPPMPGGVTEQWVYMGIGTTLPLDANLKKRPETLTGKRIVIDPTVAGGAAVPATNTFPAGGSGWITSKAIPGWKGWGDGAFTVRDPLMPTDAVNLRTLDGPLLGAWTAYTPTVLTIPSGSTVAAKYSRVGKTVTVKFAITFAGTPSGGNFLMYTPTTMAPLLGTGTYAEACGTCAFYDDSVGGGSRRGGTVVYGGNNERVAFLVDSIGGTNPVAGSIVPFTWTTGDTIAGTFTYEEA